MANIRIKDLPIGSGPVASDFVAIDQGTTRKATVEQVVDTGVPAASQSEAQTGTNNFKRMTPLSTKQSIASEVGNTIASISQGNLADSSVQSVNGKNGNSVTLVKSDLGLSNVDNTSDLSKPISTATQTALNSKAESNRGLPSGGTLGQVLAKSSSSDYAVGWVNAGAGDMLKSVYDPTNKNADVFDVKFTYLQSDVPQKVFQQYFPGISKNVQGTGLTGTDGDIFFQYANVTDPNQLSNQPLHRVQKRVQYTGGGVGVRLASWVILQVEDGPVDFHWAGLDQLINYASAGENVARYSKAEKRGTGPTWAACFDIEDYTNVGTAGGSIGLEITVKGNGGDPSLNRNGINISAHKRDKSVGAQDLEWGRGFWTSNLPSEPNNRFVYAFTNTARVLTAVFHNSGNDIAGGGVAAFVKDTGSLARGVDLSGATYSSAEAIRLAANQRIAFEATGAQYIRSTGSLIEARGARFQATSGLSFPSSGLVSSAANAGGVTKPATYAGFLSVMIDGVEKKVPFYNQ